MMIRTNTSRDKKLSLEEQTGCWKKSKVRGDLLFSKMLLKSSRKNLSMAWVEHRTACDMTMVDDMLRSPKNKSKCFKVYYL